MRPIRPAAAVVLSLLASCLPGAPPVSCEEGPAAGGGETPLFLSRAMPLGNLGGITPNARRYAISRDWRTLVAPLDSGSVLVYDVASGEPRPPLEGGFKVGTFTYHSSSDGPPPSEFGISSDGRLVHWVWGKKVVVWDAVRRDVLLREEVEGLEGFISVSRNGRVVHWRTAQGVTIRSLEDRAPEPKPAQEGPGGDEEPGLSQWAAGPTAWSRDGRVRAEINANGDVEIHDESSPGRPRVLPMREKGNRGRCASWDTSGFLGPPQLLLSRDGGVLVDSCRLTDVWDLSQPVPRLLVRTGLLRREAGRPVSSADGRTIAYSWGRGSQLMGGEGGFGLVDVPSASLLGAPIAVKYLGEMQFSPDGAWLATVGYVPRPGVKTRFEVLVWDVAAIRAAGPANR